MKVSHVVNEGSMILLTVIVFYISVVYVDVIYIQYIHIIYIIYKYIYGTSLCTSETGILATCVNVLKL